MVQSIDGTWDPKFARVIDVFQEGFAKYGEHGASIAVTLDGRPVIDAWGGHVDKARTRPWERDTLVNVFSTTKGITATCALRLVAEGRIDLDAPVASYWPEFAEAGKGAIRVRDLLDHRAGLAAIDEPLPPEAVYDWSAMTHALARQAPWWPPGTTHGYHAITFGWLVGEVVRRVSGKSVSAYFRETIGAPLGIDFFYGVPDALLDRVTDIRASPPAPPGERILFNEHMAAPQSLLAKTFVNPTPLTAAIVNSAPFRAAEIPAANGHSNARALARFYGALACGGELDGVRVLDRAMIDLARTEQSEGLDFVLKENTRFGLGFMLSQPSHPAGAFGPNPRAFGHPGAGGSVGFADPEARVGFGYAMNRMGFRILLDPRAIALIEAFYACL
jgi:CubicO group peptidase (beta-lactamase class C family)